MKNNELLWYNSVFIALLILSNLLGSKIVSIFGLMIPSATIGYAITFLVTDIVGEKFGKKEANSLVKRGGVCLIITFIIVRLSILLPSANNSDAFYQVFNISSRITLASLIAYGISQKLDVYFFHLLKNKFENKKWIRNNVSTITSQLIDTTIFTVIAFYGVIPNILFMIFSIYLIKLFIALLDTPFFYFFTKNEAA